MKAWAQDDKRQAPPGHAVQRRPAARPGVRRTRQPRAAEVASSPRSRPSIPEPVGGRRRGAQATLAQSLSTAIKIFHQALQLFTLLEQRVSKPGLQ